jgi:Na+-exporting ATPase
MALAYGVKDHIEGGVITAIIVLNVLIGFFQEFQAERKLQSLRSLTSPTARVLRNGLLDIIPATQVVPGDIILLKAGETVPADIRLIDATNMECDEKNLTGEAVPVPKDADAKFSDVEERDVSVGERINLAYSTTMVTKGHGRGIVVLTGMSTEIGKIAQSMRRVGKRHLQPTQQTGKDQEQPVRKIFKRAWYAVGAFLGFTQGTPLQIKMSKLAYLLFGSAVVLAIIVFAVNRFKVTNEVAIYAISTGMDIYPE